MTKREICERLFGVIGLIDNSHDELLRAGLNIVMPYTMAKEMLQNLVLDIAASEENHGPVILCNEDRRDFFTDAGSPKREEKPKVETSYKCPTCGFSPISKVGRDIWCPKCEMAYECEQHTETENDKL